MIDPNQLYSVQEYAAARDQSPAAAWDDIRSKRVNVVKDGKELRAHNPHNTLVYSMAKFTPEVQDAFNQTAKEFNQILPDGIPVSFKTVSIVELGFAGNVLREIYRVSLEDGSALNVATGQKVAN